VTGMGIISSIGKNVGENHLSLQQGRSGVGRARYFESNYVSQLPFGEVKADNLTLGQMAGVSGQKGFTRTCLLAFVAFEEAIRDAGLTPDELRAFDTGIVSASTVGGMCLTDQLYSDANRKSDGSEYLEAYGCGAHTLKLVQKYGIRGFSDTINTACSSSANAIMFGARLIKSGRCRRVIVGGVDSLAKYTVNGFNALKILSATNCRPFDKDRQGLNLGEAGAYLVLEAESVASNKHKYAEIKGYGNANDAYHPSAMSDEAVGAIRCMTEALLSAGISASQIDYVNAHGTGTDNNDSTELVGLKNVFDKVPPYSSTKSYTGHTLGAAGAVEAIYSILSMVNSELYASLYVENPIGESTDSPLVAFEQNKNVNYVLSNSFGFGGNCTSLVFEKV
jgi:3-oxoacyl-(acyl-carrier-protein) synthase